MALKAQIWSALEISYKKRFTEVWMAGFEMGIQIFDLKKILHQEIENPVYRHYTTFSAISVPISIKKK